VASKAAMLASSSRAAWCRLSGLRAVMIRSVPLALGERGRFETDAGAAADHYHGLPEHLIVAPL
jgi:hypothetical protein